MPWPLHSYRSSDHDHTPRNASGWAFCPSYNSLLGVLVQYTATHSRKATRIRHDISAASSHAQVAFISRVGCHREARKGLFSPIPHPLIHADRPEYLARMVNYNDPIVLSRDFCMHTLSRTLENIEPVCLSVAMVRFWHVVNGLYMYVHLTLPARPPSFT